MKKIYLIIKTILLITVILLASACGTGAKRSKDECLQEFFSNAKAGKWSSMYQQIHPDHPNYNNWKSGDYFMSIYDTSITYSIQSRDGDTYTVYIDDLAHTGDETFIFRREDDDVFSDGYWSIISFTN